MDILQLKDIKTVPDSIQPYPKQARDGNTPIVIDNGSCNCRVGWATSEKPLLVFKNLIAKPRKERGKKDGETQVGNDIANIEAVRFQLKTQFDRNVVTHIDVQEQILDYTFSHLGIDTEGSINHPIVLTEAPLNPNFCRMLVSELLFECYRVPAAAYGIDSLFSLQRNTSDNVSRQTCLVLSLGYHCTHVLPVVHGVVDWSRARRLDVGGCHITSYLHRLLQLKYPSHFAAITLSRAEELLHEHCFIACDYGEELEAWSGEEHYEQLVRRVQLPYSVGLSAEQQREKRRELARRLMEINARKREQKLAEDEEQLNQLLAIQELEEEEDEEELQRALKLFNLSSSDDLRKLIDQVQARIERTRQRIVTANTTEEPIEEPKPKISKYISTPKEEEDIQQWIAGLKKKRQEILERRNARRQRRQDMARRRTVAAQERMRLINQLARKEKKDDDFGMRDEDWDVYKAINKEGGDTDSDEESEKLLELEDMLRSHDPMFVGSGEQAAATPGEAHQLHVGVERLRAPEVLFQPAMIGCQQAGLAETVQFVLRCYNESTAAALVNRVFLTGSCALIPGLSERLTKELREMRPFKSRFSVEIASDPIFDAWNGARDFACDSTFLESCISRQEYLEKGGEYLKEHYASNVYCRSPAPLKLNDNINLSTSIVQEEIEVDIM